MVRLIIALTMLSASAACAHAPDVETAPAVEASAGLITKTSTYSFEETIVRLEDALQARGIKVMAKVDHAENARGANLDLPPTTLIIFGNPKAGTLLMQTSRSAAIDLPMKALIYQEGNVVIVQYNEIFYIAGRHGISSDLPVLPKIASLLDAVTDEATRPE